MESIENIKSYYLNDDTLYIDVDGDTFTIDLLSQILDDIIISLGLEEAEQISEIQIVRV